MSCSLGSAHCVFGDSKRLTLSFDVLNRSFLLLHVDFDFQHNLSSTSAPFLAVLGPQNGVPGGSLGGSFLLSCLLLSSVAFLCPHFLNKCCIPRRFFAHSPAQIKCRAEGAFGSLLWSERTNEALLHACSIRITD